MKRIVSHFGPALALLLCAPSAEELVTTIRSRCRLVTLRTPPSAAVAEVLVEVALRIHEADADERHAEVARFLAVIAGEHAEAARVDGQRLVQRELGGEVRDRLRPQSGSRKNPLSGSRKNTGPARLTSGTFLLTWREPPSS